MTKGVFHETDSADATDKLVTITELFRWHLLNPPHETHPSSLWPILIPTYGTPMSHSSDRHPDEHELRHRNDAIRTHTR